jgi:hypothetical protein
MLSKTNLTTVNKWEVYGLGITINAVSRLLTFVRGLDLWDKQPNNNSDLQIYVQIMTTDSNDLNL